MRRSESFVEVSSALLAAAIATTTCIIVSWSFYKKNNNNNKNNRNNNNNSDDSEIVVVQKGRSINNDNNNNNNNEEEEEVKQKYIYLDYNGTTPIYPDVLKSMIPYFKLHYGNPNSSHVGADIPREAIITARKQILYDLLGCDKNITPLSTCIFTSCGTESDNLAIHLALQKPVITKTNKPPHIVTCNIEHAAIDGYLKLLQSQGKCDVTFVPVQSNGCVLPSDIIDAIQPNTVLVTLMLANNEVGSIQPIKEISEYCNKKDILIHTDAAQAVGKVSVNINDLGNPTMITIVGHKIGAPKGIACLYIKPNTFNSDSNESNDDNKIYGHMNGLLIGGGQEYGLRGGTCNVPYIVGFGIAASNCTKHLIENKQHMELMRHRLLTRLKDGIDDIIVNGPNDEPTKRLPNTLSIAFGGGIHSGTLLAAIRNQVCASAGATCHSANGPVSTVLKAMNVPDDYARATIRLSLGPKTTPDEIDTAATIIINEVHKQRKTKITNI